MIPNYSMIPAAAIPWSPGIRWSTAIRWSPAIWWSIRSMDFDNRKVYVDTSITDGLVNAIIILDKPPTFFSHHHYHSPLSRCEWVRFFYRHHLPTPNQPRNHPSPSPFAFIAVRVSAIFFYRHHPPPPKTIPLLHPITILIYIWVYIAFKLFSSLDNLAFIRCVLDFPSFLST